MREEVKVPSVGESVTEGVIALWARKDGEFVERDEPLFDLETDKVTMPVNSPVAGRLSILAKEGQKVNVGDVVAILDTEARPESAPSAPKEPDQRAKQPAAPAAATIGKELPSKKTPSTGKPAPPAIVAPVAAALQDLAPSVRRLLEENHLDPAAIPATGKGGRLTKEDVVRYLEQRKADEVSRASPHVAPLRGSAAEEDVAPAAEPSAPPSRPHGERRQTRMPLSPLRARVAQRLLQAQQTAVMVTTFSEADLTAVLALRERYKDLFEQRYGLRLGFMSFFVKAAVDALNTVPALNAQIDGDEIVQNHFFDIGVAVSTDKGLVVPVVHDCDHLTLPELERAIQDYAQRARERKLTLDDLAGGCFTISNGGVFGSLLSTPMLNPPQSGILGMHAIKDRPVVVNGQIVIRPMMYLALTYDHRLVDGREGVTFLKRIVECIENPERMMLEV